MSYRRWEREFFGQKLVIENGKMAKQADGAVVLRYADSVLLTTVNGNEQAVPGTDFLPLTVEYQEKFYAAGKIPGGFLKRESRPSDNAVLSARIIDRPIRPLFPDGMRNEIQVIVTVLSADPDNPPDIWGIMASSLVLNISPIPFEGIVAGVQVGYVDGKYVVFPSADELERSELDIVVAGTEDAVAMVEGEAKEVSEEVMVGALEAAHEAIKSLVAFQKEIISEFQTEKWELEIPAAPEGFLESFDTLVDRNKLAEIMLTPGKKNKDKALKTYRDELIEQFIGKAKETWSEEEIEDNIGFVKDFYHDIEKKVMRRRVIEEDVRMDGRKHNEIRPINIELDLLPRAHGSALFTRGETQSLGIVTLGATMDEQIVDTMFEEGSKSFMLHYNFPPFSTGEVKRLRGPGRREIGHGHLAERSLKNIVPNGESFPYTIRVVSEVLESNGSSSMATVCSGSLSLMAAGVPMEKHVAGVAMGMIQEPEKTVVLTDILGNEDHMGDMDFKVTGTRDGITAFQMDVKVSGVSSEIMTKALEQARLARLKILDLMYEAIPEPRKFVSDYAPIIRTINLPYEKIGEIIGPGGKVIKKLSSEYDSTIFIDDERSQAKIVGSNREKLDQLEKVIDAIISEVKPGQLFEGKISRAEAYGFFVEIAPGKTGLLHISKMGASGKDFLREHKVGDTIAVEVAGTDQMGKISLKLEGVEVKEDSKRDNKRPYHRNDRNDRNRGDRNRK
ncbi:polyribonucleotide nucleotidyltransferase [Mesotoga prima MesG1.Ag.4.2]|uniref:Polyribonucleotide nucleotidyltransferase n=1 Tax=Mesotoga prima MesG1.Ag.4.2 TaxID=660470 RepID=I2F1Y1_9BACT|nr:polyribonucleotide nucleotidyltransferase [Mesotoga prima]AFK05934.1 polyribonucleotide nucleotidyltransferase [Mesotoga prima MesG1.Ag.4.2]